MRSSGEEKDEGLWRPPWEDDEATELPGRPAPRKPATEPDYTYPLLSPLARAQDAVARLEAGVATAAPSIAEGLRARTAYREAAGWLAAEHVWIHPQDLALRDAGLTGSYGLAAMAGRLASELPATAAQGIDLDVAPPDLAVERALRFAGLWRRLAEFRTWAPLSDAGTLRETLQSLGCGSTAEIDDWLALVHRREDGPALIRAGRLGRDWMNGPKADMLGGIFLAACLWRAKGFGRPVTLPFWSAPEQRHHRLALCVGTAWMAGFLDCVADAARIGLSDLGKLHQATEKSHSLARTARSRLPAALDAVLRAPIVTARGLAGTLRVTPQAALGLLRELVAAGILREATGRASWRAFVISS